MCQLLFWTCPCPPICQSPRPDGGPREGQRPPKQGLMSYRDNDDDDDDGDDDDDEALV